MKNIMTICCAVILLLTACNGNKGNSNDVFTKVLTPNNITSQVFSINPNSDTVLRGKNGTVLRIYKNTFVDSIGQPAKAGITIELKEALTPLDMVLGNLTTITKQGVLESGGMIFINANSDGKQLKIATGKVIGVIIPARNPANRMKLFEGEVDSNGVTWENPKPLVREPSVSKSDSIKAGGQEQGISPPSQQQQFKDTVQGQGKLLGELKVIPDTSEGDSGFFIQEIESPKGTNSFAQDYNTSYIFEVKKLGWANIDRLYYDPRTKDVELITKVRNIKDFKMVYITLIMPNEGMFIPGYQKQDETFSFTHGDYETTKLPVGAKAIIFAVAYKSDKPFFSIQNLTIQEKQTVSFSLSATTMADLKNTIQKEL